MNPAERESGEHEPRQAMRSLVLALGPGSDLPWWWDEIKADQGLCEVSYARITVRGKRSKQLSLIDLPFHFLQVLRLLLRSRSRYDYLFTVENDFNSFAVSFWQTVLHLRRPKHVILSFIMRERTRKLASRAKYRLLRFLYSSMHRAVCSSRSEVEYYTRAFRWPFGKAGFVPLLTASGMLAQEVADNEGFIFSGGRVYRDYDTLIRAVAGSDYRVVIVAEGKVPLLHDHSNIEPLSRIPLDQFNSLLARSRVVVLPLQDKAFSIGQTVLLQAMAMGKPIIATKTAGTVDYIDHCQSGILVRPHDPAELREAIGRLMHDAELRKKLGRNAKNAIRTRNLPHQYTMHVRHLLADRHT